MSVVQTYNVKTRQFQSVRFENPGKRGGDISVLCLPSQPASDR